jgi:hypothetical protein
VTLPTAQACAVLAKPPFLLKFVQNTASSPLNEGSLHSACFKGKDATALPLSELRKLIENMYDAFPSSCRLWQSRLPPS